MTILNVGELIAKLGGDDASRLRALHEIKNSLSGKLFEELRQCLKSPDYRIRLHAAHILLRAHDSMGVETFLDELKSNNADLQDLLLFKLSDEASRSGGLHDRRLVDALAEKIELMSFRNKIVAMACLLYCESPKGEEVLREICEAIPQLNSEEASQFASATIWLPKAKIVNQPGLLKHLRALARTIDIESSANLAILCGHLPAALEVEALLAEWSHSRDPYLRENAITSIKLRSQSYFGGPS
jgi:hypothetical protein